MTLVDELGARYEETLRAAIPPQAPVAILDWPAYPNVGDHAIALGQLAALRRLGHPVVHVSAQRGGPPELLARRLGTDVVVLLTGGGNVGDYWPHHQAYRERVLAAFPRSKVVQLPQSMGFDREDTLQAAQRAFDDHPDFTLLVRDTTNLAFGRERFTCRVELGPDGAFALGALARPAPATQDVLVLARDDHERTADSGAADTVDWPRPLDRLEGRLAWLATNVAARLEPRPRRPPQADRAFAAALERLAQRRLDHGAELLSRGRTVVTDRLHGHIIALLLGIPHVLADSRSGKVHDFVETWTAPSPLVTRAGSLREAIELAAAGART